MTNTQRTLIFLIVSVLIISAYFFFKIYRIQHPRLSFSSTLSAPLGNEAEETDAEIEERLATLFSPLEGETPTIGIVDDLDVVRGQDFFERAELGDKVVVYTQAGKAFLYRPSTRKIIEVGPVEFKQSTTSADVMLP